MYQALYRKYRSQTFDEMVGQEVVATTLKRPLPQEKSVTPTYFQDREEQGKPVRPRFLPRL